jgi:hypothetical protein
MLAWQHYNDDFFFCAVLCRGLATLCVWQHVCNITRTHTELWPIIYDLSKRLLNTCCIEIISLIITSSVQPIIVSRVWLTILYHFLWVNIIPHSVQGTVGRYRAELHFILFGFVWSKININICNRNTNLCYNLPQQH